MKAKAQRKDSNAYAKEEGFLTTPIFIAVLLAFAIYFGLPEAWNALPKVDLSNLPQVQQA